MRKTCLGLKSAILFVCLLLFTYLLILSRMALVRDMPSQQPLSRKSPKRPPEARKSDKNTANSQEVRFLKLYFDFNVFSAENRRLFSIEFQLHTISHITLW